MEDCKKLSKTYKLLRLLGLNYPEQEYGQVSFYSVIKRTFKTYRDSFLLKYVMNSWILSPMLPRKIRPWVLRTIGCTVGKDIFVGSQVWIDAGHTDMIILDDHSHLDARCVVLCHKRQLDNYYIGDDYAKLPYKTGVVHLCKGCSVGTDTILMPGVTIGEGAIVGAGSIVTKSIPAWTIAIGRPAKVVKELKERC